MADPVLVVEDVRKSFGGIVAVAGVSIDVQDGEIHAVIGPNGAGKTTLVSLLSGALPIDAGRILFRGGRIDGFPAHRRADLGIARSFQITSIFHEMSVQENVMLAVQARAGRAYFRFWRPAMNDDGLLEPALEVLRTVGLDAQRDRMAGDMSHGEHRQLEIAMALATRPSLLLLDEPMAGMGPEESAGMVDFIRGLRDRHAILLIEHDMDAVFALADRITVMVEGAPLRTGTPDEIRNDEAVRRAYLGDEEVAGA